MKVWIDILTPKQILFFLPLINKLEENDIQTFITTREYREVNQLMKLKNLEAVVVGKYGGKNLVQKLLSSSARLRLLTKLISKEHIDLSISFSSVESARVSFGLSIPHYCISDSPHAIAVSKLTIPLSQILFTPSAIPLKAWTQYGIKPNKIFQYKALDPYVWLSRRRVDYSPDDKKRKVTVRLEEEFASYLKIKRNNSVTLSVLEKLTQSDLNAEIIVVPRYKEQIKELRRFHNKVEILTRVVDGMTLLDSTTVFIGGGGTMNAEAALMGIPTVSIYPGDPTYIDKFLIKKGLLTRSLNPNQISKFVETCLSNEKISKRLQQKSKRILNIMEDPITIIFSKILKSI